MVGAQGRNRLLRPVGQPGERPWTARVDASSDPEEPAELLPPTRALVQAPIGAAPDSVRAWFDSAVEASEPVLDGTLASERDAADIYRRMAKAENTRRAYRAAVRAWCAWCARHDLPPLPASGQDVAAFLAGERGRKLSPETIKLRRAAIRYLHRAAGCPVPTDDVCVSETLAGIRREAAKKGVGAAQEGRRNGDHPAPAAGADPGRRAWPAGPGDSAGRLRRRAAALGAGGDPLRAAGEDRPRHPAHSAADQRRADRRGDGPPALRRYRALPGPRPRAVAAGRRPDRGAGVPADLAAARSQEATDGRAPSPAPDRQRTRSARRPWRRSSRRAPWRPGLGGTTSAATASSAARSRRAWTAASIRPS